jgi:hypothetical protein
VSDGSQLGAAFADRCRLERELGGGGMSRVRVATEMALDRPVVMKVIAGTPGWMCARRLTRHDPAVPR